MSKKPRVYSREVTRIVDEQIPAIIREAMYLRGWNAFGIYEVVDEALKDEKRKRKSPTQRPRRIEGG